MNLDAGDADVALNCDRIAPERERSCAPSRSASQNVAIAVRPCSGGSNGAATYVASGANSSTSDAVPGVRQARS